MKAKELEVLAEAVRTENHRKRALEAQKGYVRSDFARNTLTTAILGVYLHSLLVMTPLRIFLSGIQTVSTGVVSQKRYYRIISDWVRRDKLTTLNRYRRWHLCLGLPEIVQSAGLATDTRSSCIPPGRLQN